MAPKMVNNKHENHKSGSNRFAIVYYPIYNVVYGNRRQWEYPWVRMGLKPNPYPFPLY